MNGISYDYSFYNVNGYNVLHPFYKSPAEDLDVSEYQEIEVESLPPGSIATEPLNEIEMDTSQEELF